MLADKDGCNIYDASRMPKEIENDESGKNTTSSDGIDLYDIHDVDDWSNEQQLNHEED
jgi:hypothetical protein